MYSYLLAVLITNQVVAYDRYTSTVVDPSARFDVRTVGIQSHIDRALIAESRGQISDRSREMAKSLLIDPDNAKARGLSGYVRYHGEWIKTDRIIEKFEARPEFILHYKEYNVRRAEASDDADGHWKIAVWCEEHGLTDEALAHYRVTVDLDPSRTAAWNKLGYKKYHGRWISESERQSRIVEEQTRRKADEFWSKRLSNWKKMLAIPSQRDRALLYLSSVDDPRAIPSVRRILIDGDESCQREAIKILKKIDSVDSTRSIALLIPFGASESIAKAASEVLKTRKSTDYVPLLISLIVQEVKFLSKMSSGTGDPGELVADFGDFYLHRYYQPGPELNVESKRMIVRMIHQGIDPFDPATRATYTSRDISYIPYDFTKFGPLLFAPDNSLLGNHTTYFTWSFFGRNFYSNIDQYNLSNVYQYLIFMRDVSSLIRHNSSHRRHNSRIVDHLQDLSGFNYGSNKSEWIAWFKNYECSAPKSQTRTPEIKPVFNQYIPLVFEPSYHKLLTLSCFSKGTPVKTITGNRSIETLKPGDLVLTQNTESGELLYLPVLQSIRNTPQPTVSIDLGIESITSTEIHRFWIQGKGWAPARDLHPGDRVRALNGVLEVKKIEHRPVQPVFNLVVAENHDYFVGHKGALVHDNDYAPRVENPFDLIVKDSTRNP
jgi:hypothetical protein